MIEWNVSDTKHETAELSKVRYYNEDIYNIFIVSCKIIFVICFKNIDISESTDYDDALQGKNKKIKILMTELEVSLDRENREKQYFDIFIIS